MLDFLPDYRNIVAAAHNRAAPRLPLYEHIIAPVKMEEITGRPFASLLDGDESDQREFFRHYCDFFKNMGYDTVSFECCACNVVAQGEALSGHLKGAITDRKSFEAYPFDTLAKRYWESAERDRPSERPSLSVAENGQTNVEVTLDKAPPVGQNVNVVLTFVAGSDPDISITSSTSLWFSSNNYDTPQTVQLHAAKDADSLDGELELNSGHARPRTAAGAGCVCVAAKRFDCGARGFVQVGRGGHAASRRGGGGETERAIGLR